MPVRICVFNKTLQRLVSLAASATLLGGCMGAHYGPPPRALAAKAVPLSAQPQPDATHVGNAVSPRSGLAMLEPHLQAQNAGAAPVAQPTRDTVVAARWPMLRNR